MPNNLIIVESPAKARTINKFLGNDYIVVASMGHVRDLPQKELGFDPSNHFEPRYEITKDKKKTFKNTLPKNPILCHKLCVPLMFVACLGSQVFQFSSSAATSLQ